MTTPSVKAAESAPRSFSADQLVQATFLAGDNPVFVVEWKSRRILAANDAVTRVFGYGRKEVQDCTTEFLHVDPESFHRFGQLSEQVLSEGHQSYHGYFRMRRRNGEVFHTENLVYMLNDEDNQVLAVISIIRDLSDSRTTSESIRASSNFQILGDNLPGAVFQCVRLTDGSYAYNHFRGDLIRRVGLSSTTAESDFEAVIDRLVEDDQRYLMDALEHSASNLSLMDLVLRVHKEDGEILWIRGISRPRRLDDGSTVWDGIMIDITDQRLAERELRYLANHDPLTGLLNVRSFEEQVDATIADMTPGSDNLMMALVDIQRFHTINQLFGFDFGDRIIKAVADRLQSLTGKYDLLAHPSGDEFLLLLREAQGKEALNHRAQQLINLFDEPFDFDDGHHLAIRANVGMAIFPDDGDTAQNLRRRAELALNRVRGSTEREYAYYSVAMTRELADSVQLENDLRSAIDGQAIGPHYQPQYALETGRLCGFEALARWPLGDDWIAPDRFIPLAEETGLIHDMSRVLLDRVIADIDAWKHAGLAVPPVAVNFSAAQIQRPDIDDWLHETVNGRVNIASIAMEITESTFLFDFHRAQEVLEKLDASGFRLVLDDFGTGFSSLSYLSRLPFSELKVDKSFVAGMHRDGKVLPVVRAIVEMGQALGLKVVAEGVETTEQLQLLREMGCNAVQGFLLARPAPATAFTDELHRADVHPFLKDN